LSLLNNAIDKVDTKYAVKPIKSIQTTKFSGLNPQTNPFEVVDVNTKCLPSSTTPNPIPAISAISNINNICPDSTPTVRKKDPEKL
jgi:hypothetical protein